MGTPCFWPSFLICTFICICFSPSYAITGNETDRLSLLEIKAKITKDPFGVMSSWNDTTHFCQWNGVTCGKRHQRITILDLKSSKLEGSISPYVGNLSFLRILRLYNNSFSDEIPQEISRLRRLQMLRLNNNSFTGEIPANLSSCWNLSAIDLGNNKLAGKIPIFGSLSNLWYIDIRSNSLTGGIPPFFGNFSSLKILAACSNRFSGNIPQALGRLTNLWHISICENNLSGTIPPSLFNISSIKNFHVDRNQLQGTLPADLGITFPNLELFNIAANKFTGSIPVSLSNSTNLFKIIAIQNKLTGKVPDLEKLHQLQWLSISSNHLGTGADDLNFLSRLVNVTSLQLVALNDNNFHGSLPASVGNLSASLQILALSYNLISGTIPTGIQNLVNMENLSLRDNKFSSVVPIEIGMLKKLKHFLAGGNSFSGNIPSSIGNLTLLTWLSLARNHFEGHVPSSIGKCQNLLLLDLSDNNLTGNIPKEVFSLSSLSLYLDLQNNHFTGSLPDEVRNLKNLGGLYVSDNMLSGEIPNSLASCVKLEILMMQKNFFQGVIPSAFSTLRGLQVLNLSHNNLTGQIPVFLEDFISLEELNLSFNELDGMVPAEGVFKNASATSVTGNSKLCGGIPEFHLPKCVIKESNNRRFPHAAKLTVIIISGFLGVALVLSGLYLSFVRRKPVSSFSGTLQVSYHSLLKATDGFSSRNLLGMGSFGSVYKGILDEDGTVIAVKVLNLLHKRASKSFMAECQALRNIRHRNLVKIFTVCSGIDFQGNDFKALVYKFMANGSLEEWLHPSHRTANEAQDQAPKTLNFLQRLNVAIDVASAMDYLHHQCETTIVHCDLKPSNVLLNNDLTGHVGDFGLARFLQEPNHASQTSTIGVRGTVGYVAPEYGMGSEVSTRGDAYSYGILLLELFTGKRPTDDMFKEGLDLHKFAKTALPEQVVDVVDPILLQEMVDSETSTDRSHKVQECLISIMEIGVACSAEFPQERMNMSDVAAKLLSIKRKLP